MLNYGQLRITFLCATTVMNQALLDRAKMDPLLRMRKGSNGIAYGPNQRVNVEHIYE
jgi:hypothetical protein